MFTLEQIKNLVMTAVAGIKREALANSIPNPYKQFTFTIADGDQKELMYNHNYFRILNINTTTGVTVRFGSSGTPTDVVGAGIGYSLPATVDRALIANNSGGTLSITVAVAIGRIDDDRLTVANQTINTQEQRAGTLNTPVVETVASLAAAREVLASNANRIHGFIRNTHPINTVLIGDASAQVIPLAPNEVISLDGTTYGVYAYNGAGSAVDLVIHEDEV